MKIYEKRPVSDYVQRFGNFCSIAFDDPSCKFFHTPEIDGIIAYRIENKCAVVFGDPLCKHEDRNALIKAFYDFCNTKSIIYVTATEEFTQWALKHNICRCSIAFGDEVILNPADDPKARPGIYGSALRRKYRYSCREGLQVKEYTGNDAALEEAMQKVSSEWLANRKGLQVYFAHVNIFADRTNKRYFYAEHQGQIVGVLLMTRIDACKGWVINFLMLTPQAPNTTSEFLILSTLEVLDAEGCTFFSMGPIPAGHLGAMVGVGKISQWIARGTYKIAHRLLKLGGKQRYWKKFQPQTEPLYLLFSGSRIGLREIKGIMHAMNVLNDQ